MDADREPLLERIYAAFNARDIDTVLGAMADDVDWPNGWEGGRVAGRAAVRDYWQRQWAAVDPTVEPVAFAPRGDDRVAVTVHQTVRSPSGELLSEGDVQHVYTFDTNNLVTRMDIEP